MSIELATFLTFAAGSIIGVAVSQWWTRRKWQKILRDRGIEDR